MTATPIEAQKPSIAAWRERIQNFANRPIALAALAAAAFAFPLVHNNDGDIDAAANALAFAILLAINAIQAWDRRRFGRA